MSCAQATAEAIKESGHRLTPQRLMIVSVLRHAEGHVSAAEVIEQVRESYQYIDISTVYRTLSVLKEMRLISETDMGEGEYQYEWIDQLRHHHLICRKCGNVTPLDHRYLENLSTETLDDYGFQADIDHFAIFGLCKSCRC